MNSQPLCLSHVNTTFVMKRDQITAKHGTKITQNNNDNKQSNYNIIIKQTNGNISFLVLCAYFPLGLYAFS